MSTRIVLPTPERGFLKRFRVSQWSEIQAGWTPGRDHHRRWAMYDFAVVALLALATLKLVDFLTDAVPQLREAPLAAHVRDRSRRDRVDRLLGVQRLGRRDPQRNRRNVGHRLHRGWHDRAVAGALRVPHARPGDGRRDAGRARDADRSRRIAARRRSCGPEIHRSSRGRWRAAGRSRIDTAAECTDEGRRNDAPPLRAASGGASSGVVRPGTVPASRPASGGVPGAGSGRHDEFEPYEGPHAGDGRARARCAERRGDRAAHAGRVREGARRVHPGRCDPLGDRAVRTGRRDRPGRSPAGRRDARARSPSASGRAATLHLLLVATLVLLIALHALRSLFDWEGTLLLVRRARRAAVGLAVAAPSIAAWRVTGCGGWLRSRWSWWCCSSCSHRSRTSCAGARRRLRASVTVQTRRSVVVLRARRVPDGLVARCRRRDRPAPTAELRSPGVRVDVVPEHDERRQLHALRDVLR